MGAQTPKLPPFPFAKNRVDWSKVYGSWRAHRWNIDACLMFESIKREAWTDIEADARAYATAFAREFGPSGKRGLVDSVEIGNEPGGWSDRDFSRIFRATAEGLRKGDAKLKIATCNLTVGPSGKYDKSVACLAEFPALFDVLNVHTYAQLEGWPTWRRSYPEDPKLPHYLDDVKSLCRWRDAHAAGKPIWITEFGYDSTTKPQEKKGTFAKWVGVTDAQQAQWLVRSLLVFSAMPVERAYIYFFNDDDKPSVHASSGITRHFQPKPSFYALADLQRVLGDFHFERIVANEPGRLRVQEYRRRNGAKRCIWAVWSPTAVGRTSKETLHAVPGKLVSASRMPLSANPADSTTPLASQHRDGSVDVTVTESPSYLIFDGR